MPDRALNKVCYVEDDEDIQRIVRLSLERIGKMTVQIVGDPTTAIDAMKAFGPDLVLLDWMMPGMDGPTLLKEMRQRNPNLKIIFVSGYAEEAFDKSLPENEQFAFLAKPFALSALVAKVKETMTAP